MNFKGNVLYSPALRTMTSKANRQTQQAFDELVKNIETKQDNLIFKFNIEKPKYKMLADNILKITNYVLTKIDSVTGQTDTFTVEETEGSYTIKRNDEERFSEILDVFVKYINEEVYPTEKKEKSNYQDIFKSKILGEN
jgi:hypothetical protein